MSVKVFRLNYLCRAAGFCLTASTHCISIGKRWPIKGIRPCADSLSTRSSSSRQPSLLSFPVRLLITMLPLGGHAYRRNAFKSPESVAPKDSITKDLRSGTMYLLNTSQKERSPQMYHMVDRMKLRFTSSASFPPMGISGAASAPRSGPPIETSCMPKP